MMEAKKIPSKSRPPPRGRILPKIPTKSLVTQSESKPRNGRLPAIPKGVPIASKPMSNNSPMARRPLRPLHRAAAQEKAHHKKKKKHAEVEEEPKPPVVVQRKPLYDRLMAILAKDRTSDLQTVNAELQLVALHDDPNEMSQWTHEQLDELTKMAFDADTFQATLLAASVIEQMCEDQSKNSNPVLNDTFLRYVLFKLKEQKNWHRLVGVDAEHLIVNTLEADTILQAYACIMDCVYSVWLVRCNKTRPLNDLDPELEAVDQDLYDCWFEIWTMFFHTVDRYTATLVSRIGLESLSVRGLSDDSRLRYLEELTQFITLLRDQNEIDLRDRASKCFDLYSHKLDAYVCKCVLVDYESDGGGANSAAHFDDILSSLTSRCLQCGPKLLAHPDDGGIEANSNVTPENVNWRTEGIILHGIFNCFQTVKDYQQHPMDGVVRPNIADMFDKVLLQVNHHCIGDSVCNCYRSCSDPALIESCESFVCETVSDRYPSDFTPHIDAFVSHYRGVPKDRWMRALLIIYPSAKREVTKYFSLFAEMENDNQRHESFQDWRPIALSLMVKVSSDNAKLFDNKLIKSVEAIFFSKKPVLSAKALIILRNVAANHPRAMLGCGKNYYSAVAELPGMEPAPLKTVNEILRNIGLQSEEEAERVVALMENQVRHSQDRAFIEDILKQWHYIAIVYHEPVEARRALIDEYRQDPMLCKAAYEVFALATGQQTKATACVVM